MTDPSVAARLRALLSDETLDRAWLAMIATTDGENYDGVRAVLEPVLLPLLISLQAEREREIREAVLKVCNRQDSALRDYGVLSQAELNAENRIKSEVRQSLSRLASSSSPAAPPQEK